jgi:hypothetical protein
MYILSARCFGLTASTSLRDLVNQIPVFVCFGVLIYHRDIYAKAKLFCGTLSTRNFTFCRCCTARKDGPCEVNRKKLWA